jgi:hypothetical protein
MLIVLAYIFVKMLAGPLLQIEAKKACNFTIIC